MNSLKFLLSIFVALIFSSNLLSAEVKGIDVDTLVELKKKGIKIIDIRKPEMIKDTGIIPSSFRLNFYKKNGTINKEKWLRHFVDLVDGKDLKFVLISEDGEMAKKGANLLHDKRGYKNPLYLKGGFKAWTDANKQTVKVQHLKQ